MTLPSRLPVVVGVDSRPPSRIALDWAIEEAIRRRCALHLLHSRLDAPGSWAGLPGAEDRMPVAVANALAHVSTLARRLEVTAEVSPMKPSIALLDASEGAACIVMGAGGRAPALGAFLDSTFLEVAAKAACPVVVVRQFPEIGVVRPGVVVGADGSEISSEAIGYAFAQADDRQLPLTVVHLLTSDLNTARVRAASTSELAAITEQEQARAAQEVAGWAEKYPDVRVNRHVLRGHPVKALVDHSRGAELLVVGSRGRGRFAGILLGSVSRGVLQHAHCPVAVVRTRTG